jgi:hypothetical protein
MDIRHCPRFFEADLGTFLDSYFVDYLVAQKGLRRS